MEEKIPLKEENPKGLHQRYLIQKIKGLKIAGRDWFENPYYEPILEDVDPDAEYFVMRLDDGGKDSQHIEACRSAVLHYAEIIKDHIPELSKDLIERYG